MAYHLPPHTDQFYPTKIPMYYDEKHRFNIDRALSKEDVLKEHVSYPYFDASEVTFADIPKRTTQAHYNPNIDRSVLNLKNIDPQNITLDDLGTIGHETIHKTLNPVHGIEAASKLLEGPIEPYEGEYGISRSATGEYEGPKRANTYHEDPYKNEHLLLYAIENLALPESDDDSLYQDFDRYDTEFADEISSKGIGYQFPALGPYGYRQYYEPKWAMGGNAPGEVRRGILGLKDTFRHAALRYKSILENYNKKRRARASPAHRRPPRVKPVLPRGGGADVFNMPIPPSKKTYVAPLGPRGDGGGRPRPDKPGGFTDPGKGSYGPHKADGGLIDFYKYGGFVG